MMMMIYIYIYIYIYILYIYISQIELCRYKVKRAQFTPPEMRKWHSALLVIYVANTNLDNFTVFGNHSEVERLVEAIRK